MAMHKKDACGQWIIGLMRKTSVTESLEAFDSSPNYVT